MRVSYSCPVISLVPLSQNLLPHRETSQPQDLRPNLPNLLHLTDHLQHHHLNHDYHHYHHHYQHDHQDHHQHQL